MSERCQSCSAFADEPHRGGCLSERIRTLEAEVAYWQEEARRYAQNADHHQTEAEQFKGLWNRAAMGVLDLQAEVARLTRGWQDQVRTFIEQRDAAQARVRELEEKLNKLMQAPPGTIIVPFPL